MDDVDFSQIDAHIKQAKEALEESSNFEEDNPVDMFANFGHFGSSAGNTHAAIDDKLYSKHGNVSVVTSNDTETSHQRNEDVKIVTAEFDSLVRHDGNNSSDEYAIDPLLNLLIDS